MGRIEYKKIADRIRYFRTQLDVTQEDLAERVEISPTHLGRIERGEKKPSLSLLIRIANALQLSVDDLLVDSMTTPSKTRMDSNYSFLLDCSPAENDILIKTAVAMKRILRTHVIIK